MKSPYDRGREVDAAVATGLKAGTHTGAAEIAGKKEFEERHRRELAEHARVRRTNGSVSGRAILDTLDRGRR
jgi:hypothetical protein